MIIVFSKKNWITIFNLRIHHCSKFANYLRRIHSFVSSIFQLETIIGNGKMAMNNVLVKSTHPLNHATIQCHAKCPNCSRILCTHGTK